MAQTPQPPKTTTASVSASNAMELFSKLDPMADNFEQALLEAEKAMLESVKGWSRQQVGFPPYWSPMREGSLFFGRIVALDTRQPDFYRYIVQATKFPMFCKLGPTDDAEKIMVPTGDFFTVSAYASLPLEDFFDIEVLVEATKKRKLPGNEASKGVKRDLWMWNVRVESEKEKKMIETRRSEKAKQLMEERALTETSEG
jgi:hypothetical protein